MKTINIKQNKVKLLWIILGPLSFVIIGIWMFLYVVDNYHAIGYQSTKLLRYKDTSIVLSIITVLFFGTGLIYLVYRLFKYKYLLIITKEGFYDYSTMSTIGFVPWSDVKNINLYVIASQKLIGVNVKKIKKKLSSTSWYKRKFTNWNVIGGLSPITINLNSAKENVDDVILIMNKYWDEWKKNNEQIK